MTGKDLSLLLEDAEQVRAACIGILREQGLVAMSALLRQVEIRWSNDLTVTAGIARRDAVLLSAPIFTLPENQHDFADTVIHELAHIATPKHGHDGLWKHVAQMLGGSGERFHHLKVNRGGRGRRSYPLRCDRCHATIYVTLSDSRDVRDGRIVMTHRTCDGRLEQYRLASTALIMQANRIRNQLERIERDIAIGEAHGSR